VLVLKYEKSFQLEKLSKILEHNHQNAGSISFSLIYFPRSWGMENFRGGPDSFFCYWPQNIPIPIVLNKF
jgi:hypothetical protein